MSRRSPVPQAIAVVASLSINAILFVGLRQLGGLSPRADAEVSPLFVLDLASGDARPRARSERRVHDRTRVGRTRAPRLREPADALVVAAAVDATQEPMTAPAATTAGDRWRLPPQTQGRTQFPTAFQRSLAAPAPNLERPPVLAGVAFRDGSFAGFLARLGKMTDCGELASARTHHPESAATIARTMERLGCHE